jgi:ligand-binding SRPBCC domain-containing protein
MKAFSFRRRQLLPISIEEAWAFFSSPQNLVKITPSKMNFQILEIGGGERLHVGQQIRYNVNIHPLARIEWITEITHVNEPFEFTDIQKQGPYSFWEHKHIFHEVDSGTEMIDEISYAVPGGAIGQLLNVLFVAREVNAIFDHRYNVLRELFPAKSNVIQL